MPSGTVDGTLAGWFDPADGHRVQLVAGERITIEVTGDPGLDPDLIVWRPGAPARTPAAPAVYVRRWSAASSLKPGPVERLEYTATRAGIHTVEVRAGRGRGAYRLTVTREPSVTTQVPPPTGG